MGLWLGSSDIMDGEAANISARGMNWMVYWYVVAMLRDGLQPMFIGIDLYPLCLDWHGMDDHEMTNFVFFLALLKWCKDDHMCPHHSNLWLSPSSPNRPTRPLKWPQNGTPPIWMVKWPICSVKDGLRERWQVARIVSQFKKGFPTSVSSNLSNEGDIYWVKKRTRHKFGFPNANQANQWQSNILNSHFQSLNSSPYEALKIGVRRGWSRLDTWEVPCRWILATPKFRICIINYPY